MWMCTLTTVWKKQNFLVLLYKQIRTTKAIHVVCYYFKSMIKRFSPHANNWLRLFSPTISHFVKIPNETTDCREWISKMSIFTRLCIYLLMYFNITIFTNGYLIAKYMYVWTVNFNNAYTIIDINVDITSNFLLVQLWMTSGLIVCKADNQIDKPHRIFFLWDINLQ